MMQVDLNCDMGESFGVYTIGNDEDAMKSITSANIACGFHAGDPSVARRTVRLARDAGVAVGAHPGFPDLVGFGRREMQVTVAEVEDLVLYQVSALSGIALAEGIHLQHVKAHGALYNMAVKNLALAEAISRAVASLDPSLILFGPPGSALLSAGESAGLPVASETFADRTYEADGTLTPRSRPGAVLHDPEQILERVLHMLREQSITAVDGSVLQLSAQTICIHGDTAGALEITSRLRAGLETSGIKVCSLSS